MRLTPCMFAADIPQVGVQPLTVVRSFDSTEQIAWSDRAADVMRFVDKFGLEGMEPVLDRCIVPAIALSAHRSRMPFAFSSLR